MTKILNLDQFSTTTDRILKIKGVDYPIDEMTVANFIETTRTVQKLSSDDASIADQIEATIDAICRCVPSLPRKTIEGYSLEVLKKISEFVRGEDVEGQEVVEGEEGK